MLPTPKPLAEMTKLVDAWKKKPADAGARKAVLEMLETPEYRDMGGAGSSENYILRNRPFITAHKLKLFRQNPWFAWMAFEEEIVMPFEDPQHFVDGQAIDDLITLGDESFGNRYAVVDRTIEDIDAAVAEVDQDISAIDARIAECQKDLKKDGTRSLSGIKNEESAVRRRKEALAKREAIAGIRGKIQLTPARIATVARAGQEYFTRHYFPKKPTKQHIIFLMFDKIPVKMELDHLEFGSHFGDIKSTANIETFDPMKWDYPFTMGVYFHGVREVYDEKLPGRLYVVDKNGNYSRSDCYEYSVPTLEAQQGIVNEAATEYMKCRESHVWPWKLNMQNSEDRKTFFRSKFYAHPLCQQFKDRMQPISL